MVAHRRASATLVLAALIACGARTPLDVTVDASAPDVHTTDAAPPHDAATDPIEEPPPPCDFGTIVSDPFGSTVSWNGGAPVPAGHYRVTYVDGCMKYSSGQDWTVNAYANGPDTLFVVANGGQLGPAPGTVGFLQGQGAYASFDECVNANVGGDVPFEFDFAGGTLGLQLADNPYADNVAGESGRSPTYRLTCTPLVPTCDWLTPFESVAPISELDSPPGAGELRLSQDELTGYFYRGGDIYVTQRPSLVSFFGVPALANDVSSPAFDADPFLSADGLSLYLNSNRPGTEGDSDIFVATRATTTDAFSAPLDLASVSSTAYDGTPYLTNDGSQLWIASSRAGAIHLFFAYSLGATGFAAPTPVDELDAPGAQDNNPVLTADGLTIYFSSNRNGSTQVFVAHRANELDSFSPPSLVDEISTSGSDYASWISPDSCRLYMTRGTAAGFQLYVATRH